MNLKELPPKIDFNFLEETEKIERLRDLLQKNPQSSLDDLHFFTSLEYQEIVRLQKLIIEERTSQQPPSEKQLREWKRIKSGKKKLLSDAWLVESSTQIELWGDFGGERKMLATFLISEKMMNAEVAARGAMNYLEIFWKDELIRSGEITEPEVFTVTRKMGSFRETEFPYEPPGTIGLLEENF